MENHVSNSDSQLLRGVFTSSNLANVCPFTLKGLWPHPKYIFDSEARGIYNWSPYFDLQKVDKFNTQQQV